jgi:ubiquitin-like protein Pup
MAERANQVRQDPPADRRGSSTEEVRSGASSDVDIEQILDEIDEVLEANAEDFVRNYVQKGGE